MNPLYIVLGILIIGFPVFRTESFRYQECLHECWKRHTANTNLLETDICKNPHKRLQYVNTGKVNCDEAERELLLTPTQCAFRLWWKDNELVHLYFRLAGSYWNLIGIFLPIVLFVLWLVGKYVREKASEERFYDRQSKFVQNLLPQLSHNSGRESVRISDREYDESPLLEFGSKKFRK